MKEKISVLDNILGSWRHIPYTWKHYVAFMKTQKKLLGRYKYKFHDLDKLGMYLFLPFLGTKRIGSIHRKHSKHHVGNSIGFTDWTEAIIDWECARFTKPDKPYNARETMERWYSEYRDVLEPHLRKLGL